MATKVLRPALVVKTCDMCGDEKTHFIGGGKFSVCRGFVQTQCDRWEKQMNVMVSASIPYHPCNDICSDCLRETFNQIIRDIEVCEDA